MKKELLICCVAVAALTGCSQSGKNATNEANANKEMNDFSSDDLMTFGLKGHVKSMTETLDGNNKLCEVEFSPKGIANVIYYLDTDCKVGRDEKGRIKTIGTVLDEMQDGTFYSFDYNDDGTVKTITTEIPSYFMAFPEEYGDFDENGWPTSMTTEGGEGGYMMRQELSYTYPGIDEAGNWTIKNGTGITTETEGDDDDESSSTTTETNLTFTRNITYYTPEELGK